MLFIREPYRREDGSLPLSDVRRVTYGEFLEYVWRNRFVLASVTTSLVSAQYVINALLAWMPTFFTHEHHIPLRSTGLLLGLMFSVCSVTGFLLSGLLSDRLVKRGDRAGRLRPMIAAALILIPCLVAWPLVKSLLLSRLLLGIAILAVSVQLGTLPTTLQEIAPNRMRGQVVTLAMLIGSLVGWGAGPTITALITDYVFKNENAIGYSLMLATVPVALAALFSSLVAVRPYAKLRQRILDGA